MSSYSLLSDIELLDLIRSEDRSAFSQLYTRYWKKLFIVAANKIGQAEEAEEIVQDIFISLWQRRSSLQITGTLHTYLAVSVKYRVLKILSHRYQHQKYSTHSLNVNSELSNATLELLDFDELKSTLESLVAELPEKCRIIYKLSRDQGLSHRQIAENCGISEKTVEAHITKALKVLKTGLGQVFL